jgi:type I restriction enzyme, S subunit
MSKDVKKTLLPTLRFPEFRDAGRWEKIRLIDTADKKTKWSFIGGPFGSNLKSSDYVANGVRIIQLQNIGDAEFFDDYKIYTSESKADELLANNIYPGEIILSKMGDPVGRACLIPDKYARYVMCSDGIRLVVDEKVYSKYFIYTLINSVQFRALLEKTATGSTRKRIGLDELKNLPMVLPKKGEQQKIADCLSSIDVLISAQSQKVEALKTHKKGLMQQLFPRDGETIPLLRFPEFRGEGEWGQITLDKLCSSISSGKDKNDPSGDYDLFGSTGVIGKTSNGSYEGIFILAARVGANAGLLTKASGKFGVTDNTLVIILKNAENIDFMFHSLEKFGLNKMVFGSGQPLITGGQLKEVSINLPSPGEQEKVTDFLSSIDALISAQSQKVEALKTHKKGLMQALFPTVDEVEK